MWPTRLLFCPMWIQLIKGEKVGSFLVNRNNRLYHFPSQLISFEIFIYTWQNGFQRASCFFRGFRGMTYKIGQIRLIEYVTTRIYPYFLHQHRLLDTRRFLLTNSNREFWERTELLELFCLRLKSKVYSPNDCRSRRIKNNDLSWSLSLLQQWLFVDRQIWLANFVSLSLHTFSMRMTHWKSLPNARLALSASNTL